jgi:hypothetical protein
MTAQCRTCFSEVTFLLHPSQSSARDHRLSKASYGGVVCEMMVFFFTVRRVVASIFNAFGVNVITSVNFKLKYTMAREG